MDEKYLNLLLLAAYTIATSMALLTMKGALLELRAQGTWLLDNGPLLRLGGGVSLYVMSFLLWLVVLSRVPLSTALPISIGVTIVLSTVGAVLYFGERADALKLVGILLILVGIACVTWRLDA